MRARSLASSFFFTGMLCGAASAQSGPLLWHADGAASLQAFGGKLAGIVDIDG